MLSYSSRTVHLLCSKTGTFGEPFKYLKISIRSPSSLVLFFPPATPLVYRWVSLKITFRTHNTLGVVPLRHGRPTLFTMHYYGSVTLMELLRRCLKHSRLLIFMNRPTRRPEILFLLPTGSAVLFSCELLLI